MEQPTDVQGLPGEDKLTRKPSGARLWIAIPMGLVFIAIGALIYMPGMFLGGMMTDSCSGGSSAYVLWEIWLVYLWPAVMLAAALFPPFLVIKNKSWKKVLLGMLAGFGAGFVWYVLWYPVLLLSGC